MLISRGPSKRLGDRPPRVLGRRRLRDDLARHRPDLRLLLRQRRRRRLARGTRHAGLERLLADRERAMPGRALRRVDPGPRRSGLRSDRRWELDLRPFAPEIPSLGHVDTASSNQRAIEVAVAVKGSKVNRTWPCGQQFRPERIGLCRRSDHATRRRTNGERDRLRGQRRVQAQPSQSARSPHVERSQVVRGDRRRAPRADSAIFYRS